MQMGNFIIIYYHLFSTYYSIPFLFLIHDLSLAHVHSIFLVFFLCDHVLYYLYSRLILLLIIY